VLKAAGQLPKRNERIQIGEWQFTVLARGQPQAALVLVERTLVLPSGDAEKLARASSKLLPENIAGLRAMPGTVFVACGRQVTPGIDCLCQDRPPWV